MDGVAVVAITRNGVRTARKIASLHPGWGAHAPSKLDDGLGGVSWFGAPVSETLASLFGTSKALVCIFSLGAVIRLLAPHLADKKTDPAVIVIDDRCEFVISALSGHVGGANELARQIASATGAVPVITTAADVNKTIAVDLVGRKEGWRIDGDDNVTRLSAMMVNGERIGVYQDAGDPGVLGALPSNVTMYPGMPELCASGAAGALVITDRRIEPPPMPSVVYRPPSLTVGVGLHAGTQAQKILDSLGQVLERAKLSPLSVARLASVQKPARVAALDEAASSLGVPVELVGRDELAQIAAPNPSDTVARLEGTPSVSEAAALARPGGGSLVVEKQKFPPDLTLAVARAGQ